MRMQVILDSLFARPGSAPNGAGRKESSGTGLMESGFVDDSYHCLLHSSSHPQHVKNATSSSQFLRLRRICSDDSDFINKCEEMCQFFKKTSNPDSAVTTGKHRAQVIDRSRDRTTTSQNERIPFTLPHHPQNFAIKNVFVKYI